MLKEKKRFFEIEELNKYGLKGIYTKKIYNFKKIDKTTIQNLKEDLDIKKLKIIWTNQTHSTNINIIKNKDKDKDVQEKHSNIDGFITNRKDIAILMKFADCLPIYILDPIKKVFGLIHAGWKGSYNEIQKKAINLMEENFDSNINNILVYLGIGIEKKCYEVGYDFYDMFQNQYGNKINACFSHKNKKYFFDNIKFNEMILLEKGVKKENIKKSKECTFCNKNLHSYRREGKNAGRNAGLIYLDK